MTGGASPPLDVGRRAVALTVAGSDSGGGAGIQADLKTFHQFGAFGTSVVVAVTAQNTRGVSAVHSIPVSIVRAQLRAVFDDLPPAAVKTGMLADRQLVVAVAEAIEAAGVRQLIVDPVMVATSGDRLLSPDAERTLAERLVPLAALVTPNLQEAEVLTGHRIFDEHTMRDAAERLVDAGAGAALIKGGHGAGNELVDVLVTPDLTQRFPHPRMATRSTHGTGCTLSAAITAGLALGDPLPTAVERAVAFVQDALATAPGLGAGHGPLNHFVAAPAARV